MKLLSSLSHKTTYVLFQLLTFFFGCLACTLGQTVIGSYALPDLSLTQEIYPYSWVSYAGDSYGVCPRPAIRLSESEFIYLRKPKTDNQKRIITCFNIATQPQWENHLRLAKGEDIFRLYLHQGKIIALSYLKERKPWRYTIQARLFNPKDGSPLPRKKLYSIESKRPTSVWWDLSPDSSFLMLYHYSYLESKGRGYSPSLPQHTDKMGYKITHIDKLHFTVYGEDLEVVEKGEIQLGLSGKNKAYSLDSQVDNAGEYLCDYSLQNYWVNHFSEKSASISSEFPYLCQVS